MKMRMVRMSKRWADQPFWAWAAEGSPEVPVVLRALVERDSVLVAPRTADDALVYLRDRLGMRDDDTPRIRTPIVITAV
jgi:hypothetical protein